MIVICTGCQARFRVGDEKIGPRGAKVRCTRCQNVFVARRDPPPPAPAIELDLTPGLGRPAAAPDPFVAAALGGLNGPAAGADPFAPPPKQPKVMFPPTDLGRSGLLAQGAVPEQDPFAAPVADPFGAAAPSTTSQALPVTDLAQLLGGAAGGPAGIPARPTPAPRAPPPPPAATPPPAAFGDDLTLEERSDGDLAPGFADPDDVLAADAGPTSSAPDLGATSFSAAFPPGVWDDGPLGAPAPGDPALSLATEGTPAPAPLDPPAAAAAAPPPRPLPRARPDAPEPDPAAAAHPALASRGMLRSAAVNALALVALVIVALGIRAALRGDQPLGLDALRPSRLLQTFGGAQAPAAPFEVVEVRTGVYPQSSGGTVLFVRGAVLSRAAARGVKVTAELVRDEQVLARGEVLAGSEPTPEDVWKAADRAGLEALARALGEKAPRTIAAGGRLPFLVTLADAPGDLAGTSVRLQAGAAAP